MKKLKIIYAFDLFLSLLSILNLLSIIRFNKNYKFNQGNLINKGTVLSVKKTSYGNTLLIKSNKMILAYIKQDIKLDVGDIIIFSYDLKDITSFQNFNTFNYKTYLKSLNIKSALNISSYKITGSNLFYKIKNKITSFFNNKKSSSYINAFFMADKSDIDVNIKSAYKNNGISHLLCVSGFHILFLLSFIKSFLSRVFKSDILITLLLISISFIYLLLSDYSTPLYRAILFYFLNYFNVLFHLNLSKKQVFFITLNICLFNRPYILFSSSFWYTFILSYFLMQFRFENISGIYEIISISLFAFLISMPLNIYLNFSINFLSVIYSALLSGFICYIVYPASFLSLFIKPVDYLLYYLLKVFEIINLKVSGITFFTVVIPKISFIVLLLMYIFLYLYFYKKRYMWFIIYIFLIIYAKFSLYFDSSSYVYFLDVGQGDMIIYVSKNHKSVNIVDTGGIQENLYLRQNIELFLKSIGVSRIDNIITTHGDNDHMGEAINLVNNFKVEKVIFNCGEYNALEKELIKVLNKKKIKYYSCIKELNIDKNKLYFLQTKEYDNENDNSNVIYTELNGHKFMFMGDASITTEKEIMSKYNLPYIDVLKVGHHGSKTSSSKEFINKTNPKYSIISVGKNNRYGHPNKEVLDNLQNSKIYRTDDDGSIMLKIKNNKLQIETCTP